MRAEMRIPKGVWYDKVYEYWANRTKVYIPRENFCHYFWTVVLLGPAEWFFHQTLFWLIKPYMLFAGVLIPSLIYALCLILQIDLVNLLLLIVGSILLSALIMLVVIGIHCFADWLDNRYGLQIEQFKESTRGYLGYLGKFFVWFFRYHKGTVYLWKVSFSILFVLLLYMSWIFIGESFAIWAAVSLVAGLLLVWLLKYLIRFLGYLVSKCIDLYLEKQAANYARVKKEPMPMPEIFRQALAFLNLVVQRIIAFKEQFCPYVLRPGDPGYKDGEVLETK